MATAIRIPDIGTTDDQVTLVRWLKKINDAVKTGEPLCEVETDKAVSELESVAAGTLLKIVAEEGAKIGQGAVIAYVGRPGETLEAEDTGRRTDDKGRTAQGGGRTAGDEKSGRAPVPPLIRNLAVKEGVDLAEVTGTGPGGRITREDVLAAAARRPPNDAAARREANQRAVAGQVARSHREIVPIHLVCRLVMTAADRLRAGLTAGGAMPPPHDVVFIYALSRFLREFPAFMGRREGGGTGTADEVNISFAAAFTSGLYRLVVAQADRKSPAEIQRDIQQLLFRAARGQLSLADQGTACFSISNLSKYPVHSFTAIIPPGQTAALAIGAIEETVVMRDGRPAAVPVCHVTLSVDHLVINGREAGAFLARLKDVVEGL